MEHIIAYNPYKNGNKGSVSSQPLSVYDKTIAYPWMADLVAAIRGGNDELKKQLPFRCAHYYQFRDNRRSQKNAVPESFLFQTTIDVDDKEYVDKAIEKARELNCSGTIWNGALLHLEYSARKKLHIDIRMPVGMTIEETQRAYCEALGVPYDESCITPERIHHRQGVRNLSLAPLVRGAATGRTEEAQTSLSGPWAHHRRTGWES